MDEFTRSMASRSEHTTKTFSMTVQGHARLPSLFSNTSCFFFSFGVNDGDDPQSQVYIGISPEKTPGGEQECPESMDTGKGTNHGANLCISPRRLARRWRCP